MGPKKKKAAAAGDEKDPLIELLNAYKKTCIANVVPINKQLKELIDFA